MIDKDAKELIKQLQRINKNLEKLTEAVEKSNCNYIYKVTPTYCSPVPEELLKEEENGKS